MSKVFYDHLIESARFEDLVRKYSKLTEEREELWAIIDEMIHHRVMGCILDNLDVSYHQEFLDKLYEAPANDGIMIFLEKNVNRDIAFLIKKAALEIEEELWTKITEE